MLAKSRAVLVRKDASRAFVRLPFAQPVAINGLAAVWTGEQAGRGRCGWRETSPRRAELARVLCGAAVRPESAAALHAVAVRCRPEG